MSRFSKDSRYRIRDFYKRGTLKNGSCQIYFNKEVNQEYIPVHPFACESELLKDINWLPEKCTSVDAYWKMKNDVSFLQVMTKDVSDNKQVGIYIRWDKTKKQYLNIVAIIDESVVTRDIFEKIMCNVIHLGIHPSEKNRKRYGCKLQNKI